MSDETLVTCASCGTEVPHLPFCIRCGADEPGASRAVRRGRFAAAPHQRALLPELVATIFPQLPRSSMRTFRLALGFGAVVVATLAIAELYTVALLVAALVVPALTAVYLWDVDVYEDEPWPVYGLTAAAGAAMGVALGLLGRALAPATADLLTQSRTEALLEQGVLVPLAGLVLALAGPVALLFHPRFDDVLDGATFGAVSAAWLVAGQLVTQSATILDEGLRPGGSTPTWTFRLLELAVVFPVLWAGVVGAIAGSVWLRRATDRSQRAALGLLGRPPVAALVGSAALVLAASAHVRAGVLVSLGVTVSLALAALVWLRHVIQVGLQQESLESDVGPLFECANCGVATPRHTFCGACGVALRALPKQRHPVGERRLRGVAQARLANRPLLAAYAIGVVVCAAGAAGLVSRMTHGVAAAPCERRAPCVPPAAGSAQVAVSFEPWLSDAGVRLEYDPLQWRRLEGGSSKLVLQAFDESVWLAVSVGAEDAGLPEPLGLPRPLRFGEALGTPELHRPGIGYVDGVGTWHSAVVLDGNHPREASTVATITAAVDGVAVEVTAVLFGRKEDAFSPSGRLLRRAVDSILNTVEWDSRGTAAATRRAGDPRTWWTRTVVDAYGIRPLWELARGEGRLPGHGQRIALLSLDGFRDEDVETLDELAGIEGAPPVVPVTIPPGDRIRPGRFAHEVSIGVGVIRAIAPGAEILSYETARGWPEFLAALRAINDERRASLVSVTWGACLPEVPAVLRAQIEQEFSRAAERDATVFVASGDAGAYACLADDRPELRKSNHVEAVDWPAASPNVVAVGGTRMFVDGDGNPVREAAWEDVLSNNATGGGVSPLPRPAWQDAVGSADDRTGGGRRIPDVAGPADCDHGFLIVYPGGSELDPVTTSAPEGCGTSAAAPFWAALAALVQEYAELRGAGRLPFLAPVLYELSASRDSPFTDVVLGGNLKHRATPGWDYATGLGTPRGWELASAVVAYLER